MRKKRNLDERVEACSSVLIAKGRPCLNLKEAAENYRQIIDVKAVFGNENPVWLEVGCGNGYFVAELAKRRPDVNFVALEVNSNVILTAMERVVEQGIPNVRFLNTPAELIPCYFERECVEKLYLNFSTPLPEKSREKQRLTSSRFLKLYKEVLKNGGVIEQKTDSEPFFDYSLEKYAENGFVCSEICRDLHHSEYAKENIVTEYEKNFSDKGSLICRVVATKTE